MRPNAAEISFLEQLKDHLAGRVCVVGVGNRQRGDDAAGSVLAERIAMRIGALSIDAGEVPENYLEKIVGLRPDTILIIDATDFGGHAGELRIFEPDAVTSFALSTHALSLKMTADYLGARTQARVALLAIQPADVGWGRTLSGAVSGAIQWLEQTLPAALGESTGGEASGGDHGARGRG